jgi:hypothetical protein
MPLHRVSVLPDESLIVALLSSLIVALQIQEIGEGATKDEAGLEQRS